MTEFSGPVSSTQNGNAMEQIQQLQRVLDETTRKLDDVCRSRIQADEDRMKCSEETKQRVNLVMKNAKVLDVLHELGELLQKEHHLNEQLNGQSLKERDLWKDLEERNERLTNKAKDLSDKIVEVTRRLEEAMAYHKAAQSSEPEATSKSRRNQTKPK